MKILFLSHCFLPKIGGIEINSEILANNFTELGHAVRLVTWTESSQANESLFDVIRNPSWRQLWGEYRQAEVVFENNPCLRLSWPRLLHRQPHVIAICAKVSRLDGSIGWQDRVKGLWLRHADGVIAVSRAIADHAFPTSTVIGNPYRDNLFRVMPSVARTRDFAFLGRLVSDKGIDVAVQAVAKLKCDSQSNKPTLTIIGDGPERASLERMVIDLGLDAQVDFAGVMRGQNLVGELNRHKYLWVPSRCDEAFGNVALEGMACGCIPIVSDGGGLPDAVGEAGVTFERGSVEDMVRVTEWVMSDEALRERLAAAAPQHLDNHRPAVVARKYLDVIEKAVERRNR